MKILCKVNKKPALIVGYCQGHKSKVQAIVITEGQLKSVGLKDIELNELPGELDASPSAKPVSLRAKLAS